MECRCPEYSTEATRYIYDPSSAFFSLGKPSTQLYALHDHEILDSCRDYYFFALEPVNSVTVYDCVTIPSRWDYYSSDIETFNSITVAARLFMT